MDSYFSRLVLSDQIKDRVSRHVLFWLACWVFQGFLYGFIYSADSWIQVFTISFAESFFFLPQHIFLSYSIIYFVLPQYFFKEKYWSGVAFVLLVIFISAVFSPVTQFFVIKPFREWMNFPHTLKNIYFSLLGGLRGSMTVAGFAVAIKLLKYWYFKKTENEQLEKEKLKAELELLKGQLHPHFMFNTLNSIYSMALKNSTQTADAILKLSNLMRYMMAESNRAFIPLEDEIKILKTYIDMEKNRFGDRIDLTLNIQGELGDKTIAPLLLLPFVENGFKHGTNQMQEHAWMSMDVSVKENELKFKLINGKPEEAHPGIISSGIGLQNVKKRLALLYPGSHDLRITEDETTFIVSLAVRLK
jgi:sensor histidine kinase YesM